MLIFNLVYGTNEFRKGASFNFDTIALIHVTHISKNAMFITPELKALDDKSVDGSKNAVEGDGF